MVFSGGPVARSLVFCRVLPFQTTLVFTGGPVARSLVFCRVLPFQTTLEFSGGPVARSLFLCVVFYPSIPPWGLVVVLLLDL